MAEELKTITIRIDNKEIKAKPSQTILEVALQNNIKIPSLCYHSDLKAKASCRVCVVEIKGYKYPEPACSTQVKQGMEITTMSPVLRALRKTNLELLFSQHNEECNDCVWNYNCQLLKLAKEYDVKINKFKDRKADYPVYQFGPSPDENKTISKKPVLIFDSSKCIGCGNCIEACQQQEVRYLELKEKNTFHQVTPSKHRECIFCGQCLLRCPAGAFEAESEFEKIEEPLKQKNKIIVFQIAPSIRTSIGQDFGLEPGEAITEKISAGLKKLGADKVFDVSVGADFTTTEEAKEMLSKLKGGTCFTLFSSCCPAWVRFVELYYPEFIEHIASARPPHIISGGLIKTYFAQKQKIDREDIFVVSVMPCIAKKYEIERKEMLINLPGKEPIKPVDYVLTTRELSRLFLKHKIDLKNIKPQKLDNPLGVPSGAGVIYGASGGVMESALRNAFFELNNGKLPEIDFQDVRGQAGIKIAEIKTPKQTLIMAVVSGTGNAKKILDELKVAPGKYSCIEVMACPGGCIGGGGQPLPTDNTIRKQRADGLYQIDQKKKIRIALENPIVKKIYQEFLTNPEIIKTVCHTTYKKT